MLTQRKRMMVYDLLMAIFMVLAPKTNAEPLCSIYDKGKACKKHGCVYVRFKNKDNVCVHVPNEGDCELKDTRFSCRNIGCKWDRKSKVCLGIDTESSEDGENRDAPIDNQIGTGRDPDPVDDDRDPWGNDRSPPNPGNRDGSDEFFESLLGTDADEAIVAIDEEYDSYYHAYICGKPDSDPQCFMRNMDNTRVKLETDDDNNVTSFSVG